ncbi:MAG TPA: hypothetical protein DEG88_03660 [Propionibacteriaceae bacterium]|jgi:LysM repeat protein|nr:LysM peptidoglycan-binding domain-containing protein [Micropruina sp.]HBX81606.1 hypothetical protein [Propionibacteriaceae bacterium]HBY22408.1 hypothetical protein [Propionibacteriaceae bacterium]
MRIVRGLGALLLLLAGLLAAPYALLRWGAGIESLTPTQWLVDPGSALRLLLTLGGWVAWVAFVACVIAEMLALLTHGRLRARFLPSGRAIAGALLLSVAALASLRGASAPPPPQGPALVVVQTAMVEAREDAPETPAAVAGSTHVVAPGDDLWTLAEAHLGDGARWREIATLNKAVAQDPLKALHAGTKLAIPAVSDRTVVVAPGDSLSKLALRHLGAANRWPEIHRLNRDRIKNPDYIQVGWVLRLPTETSPSRSDNPSAEAEPDVSVATPETAARVAPAAATSTVLIPAGTPERAAAPPAAVAPTRNASAVATSPTTGATSEPTSSSTPRATPTPTPIPSVASASIGPTAAAPAPEDGDESSAASANLPAVDPTLALIGGLGSTAAGAVLIGLGLRREVRLNARPVGRRFVTPSPTNQRFETALGVRGASAAGDGFENACRAIAAHCQRRGVAPPVLRTATITAARIEFRWAGESSDPPAPFERIADGWQVDPRMLYPPAHPHPHPYPATVTLGNDSQGQQTLVDLEALGSLSVSSDNPELALDVFSALALELSNHPWAGELEVVLVGADPAFLMVAAREPVRAVADPATGVDLVEATIAERLASLEPGDTVTALRCDPDRAAAWQPVVFCFLEALGSTERQRLTQALDGPAAGVVVLQLGDDSPSWRVDERETPRGKLDVLGLRLSAQAIPAHARIAISSLFTVADAGEQTPAPWWFETPEGTTPLRVSTPALPDADVHPFLRLLGPVELRGARGEEPDRSRRQCEEALGWLLEHPKRTATSMCAGLMLAEPTRRSNMSRLRTWLGKDPDGELYLPDAYSGRITLHPGVSSDWQRLQTLVSPGVNRLDDPALIQALEMIGGAPLADAAPGQWHWAEAMRTDMAATLRDVGAVLTRHALHNGDVDLARWAASRALIASPDDEELIRWRIRTEQRAGNAAEVERLVQRVTRHARNLGVDLDDETVDLCQAAMEGRRRSRG